MRIRNIMIRTYSFVRHCGRKMNKKCSRWPEHLSDKGIIPRTGIESESFHISTYAKDLYNTTKNDRITYINDPLTTSTTISKSIYILTMPLEQEIPNLKLIKTVKAEQSTIGTVWGRHLLMSVKPRFIWNRTRNPDAEYKWYNKGACHEWKVLNDFVKQFCRILKTVLEQRGLLQCYTDAQGKIITQQFLYNRLSFHDTIWW